MSASLSICPAPTVNVSVPCSVQLLTKHQSTPFRMRDSPRSNLSVAVQNAFSNTEPVCSTRCVRLRESNKPVLSLLDAEESNTQPDIPIYAILGSADFMSSPKIGCLSSAFWVFRQCKKKNVLVLSDRSRQGAVLTALQLYRACLLSGGVLIWLKMVWDR